MKKLTLFDAYCADLRHAMDTLCYYSREAASRAAALNATYKPGSIAAFASGDSVVLKYSDGSSERTDCPEQAAAIRAYAKDKQTTRPNFFAVVSAVQSKRTVTA